MPPHLLTIGHSNLPAERFMALLTSAGVTAVADVRSVPFSRWCPWFSAKALTERLVNEGMAYLALGDALGGRPRDPKLYRDGVADYEAMAARPEFAAGLARVVDETAHHRICLLVGRALTERGLKLGHIRVDGSVEPHAATEDRLLTLAGGDADLFSDRGERLAHAYRRRAHAVAARLKA